MAEWGYIYINSRISGLVLDWLDSDWEGRV